MIFLYRVLQKIFFCLLIFLIFSYYLNNNLHAYLLKGVTLNHEKQKIRLHGYIIPEEGDAAFYKDWFHAFIMHPGYTQQVVSLKGLRRSRYIPVLRKKKELYFGVVRFVITWVRKENIQLPVYPTLCFLFIRFLESEKYASQGIFHKIKIQEDKK